MADLRQTPGAVETCLYYSYGACRDGEYCRYRHIMAERYEATLRESVSSQRTVLRLPQHCVYFKQGYCRFANQCRFIHNTPLARVNDATPSNSDEIPSNSIDTPSSSTETPSSNTESLSNNTDIPSTSAVIPSSSTETPSTSSKTSPNSTETALNTIMNDELSGEEWVNAPEFIPQQPCESTSANSSENRMDTLVESTASRLSPPVDKKPRLHALEVDATIQCQGQCKVNKTGDTCSLCNNSTIDALNMKLLQEKDAWIRKQEVNVIELSRAVARSKDKTCGVCYEVIMEKAPMEQRFGILPNCNHCYCLDCIRKWRNTRQFESSIVRACPECRILSDFVCPSMYWVDSKEDKDKLIEQYKIALSTKDCKYFNQGRGQCPFGNKCFYMHALPDGTITDVGPPPFRIRRNPDDDRDLELFRQIMIWDFLGLREQITRRPNIDHLQDMVSDSEDSDWSDYDVYFD